MLVFSIVRNANTLTTSLINDLLDSDVIDVMQGTKNEITRSESSRCVVYKDINPSLVVHSIYRKKNVINEQHRISFTWFRV